MDPADASVVNMYALEITLAIFVSAYIAFEILIRTLSHVRTPTQLMYAQYRLWRQTDVRVDERDKCM